MASVIGTWLITTYPTINSSDNGSYSINFTSNGKEFSTFRFVTTTAFNYYYIYYGSTHAYTSYVFDPDSSTYCKWSNTAYKTITITGGADVNNSTLYNWLKANATDITELSFKHYYKHSLIGDGDGKFRRYQSRLDAPTNLSITDDTLEFDAVENATSYEVFADLKSIGEVEVGGGEE